MGRQSYITYTLSDADVEQAIKEFIAREEGHPIAEQTVKIAIDGGSPYYNQFDQGTPASVKFTVEVKR